MRYRCDSETLKLHVLGQCGRKDFPGGANLKRKREGSRGGGNFGDPCTSKLAC